MNASESIVYHNEQPKLGKLYGVDATSGILVVAYPNENATTSFEFEYYTGMVSEDELDQFSWELHRDPKDQNNFIMTVGIVAGAFSWCVLMACCCQKDPKNIEKKKKEEEADEEINETKIANIK